ncbi:Mobile element protein [hydrothermal vent metagenome]|uniref:Mobile element protein n=1 Tax=hydrothermal vent metagenome TaxID=652676 RepID=A0A3B0X2U7_9ZZZZ
MTHGEIVVIDGKTLRRSHDRSNKVAAIHMVSAWACENGLVLGQLKTEEKSNEITAIPKLLKLLELHNCIVTIDAMGCQKKIAKTIQDQGADYVLALKGNQRNLHNDVTLYLDNAINKGNLNNTFDFHETIGADHGRIEIRRYWICNDINRLDQDREWQGLKSIGLAESERHIGDKKTIERRYFITSLDNNIDNEFSRCLVRILF